MSCTSWATFIKIIEDTFNPKVIISLRVSLFLSLGNDIDAIKAEVCSPKVTNRDMNKTVSWNNVPLDPNAVASPCGYIGISHHNF